MKTLIRLILVLAFAVTAAPMAAPRAGSFGAPERDLAKPNYDLASRWTAAKIGKMVFDTSVTPHWLEFSDRFWYTYETPAGRKWWIVDPIKKAKTPLWDNAKMAAQLTRILRTPYDAQHLPVNTIKFIKSDAVIQFSVSLPKDAKVENAAGEEIVNDTQQTQTQQVQGGGGAGRGGAAGAGGAAANTKQWWFEYDVATGTVALNEKYEPEKPKPGWASLSPDKQTAVFARGQNLFMMDAKNYELALKKADDPAIVEVQLTTDGEKDYSYGRSGGPGGVDQQQQQQQQQDTQTTTQDTQGAQAARPNQSEQDKKFGPRTAPVSVSWSQDNKKFALMRTDSRKVADLWVINALANPRPTLETYKYGMPGEDNQPQEEMHVLDVTAKQNELVKTEAFKDQNLGMVSAPITNLEREKQETTPRWVTFGPDKVFYTRISRDLKRVDLVEANTATGESHVVIPERSNVYIETQPVRLLGGGKELIFWSERDGWGHYYLFDGTGKLKRQIDSGEFVDTGVVSVDEKTRTMFVTAVGKEPNEDPYFPHLYKVNIDTGDMKLLDPGNASHAVSMNDKCTYFVDNSSRVNSVPESALYDTLGGKVMDLEKTDVSLLMASGYKYPEPFTVKADDGITDIYGVMFKPFDFDPEKRYPIIEYVYPGPQTESVTKTFAPRNLNVALANVGFIVIEVGNRGGNPQRSKWYHTFGYGNLRDYGLPDKKAAVEQLAKRYPWIDLNRVGIYGHSGGGFMTAAAMFGFPDFFKVGISESGNHDNSVYNRSWSEKHDGVKELPPDKDGKIKFEYEIDKNQDIAKNLKGKLLLITGDIDNNVHPSNTYRVVDALVRAGKRFDFMILPGQRHGYTTDGDYVYWRRIDYFSQHLLGSAPMDTDMLELLREREIKK
jgi:dipeptidyl aminopeptidase/acylaminoacyl peptidase